MKKVREGKLVSVYVSDQKYEKIRKEMIKLNLRSMTQAVNLMIDKYFGQPSEPDPEPEIEDSVQVSIDDSEPGTEQENVSEFANYLNNIDI